MVLICISLITVNVEPFHVLICQPYIHLNLKQCRGQCRTLGAAQNLPIAYSQSTYLEFFHICDSAFVDLTNFRSYNIVVLITEKNSCLSGPTQFKPMLFKS